MMHLFKRVAIAKEGEYPVGHTGGAPKPFTRRTFEDIIAGASADARKPKPKIGLGPAHSDARKPNGYNGTPDLGTVENHVIDTDPADGKLTLYADLTMPMWVAEGYPDRSVELWEYPDGTVTMSRLAMLGDEVPAVWDLPPVDRAAAFEAMLTDEGPAEVLAAAASARPSLVTGSAVSTPLPKPSPAGADQPDPLGSDHIEEEAARMPDLNELRESLGLPEGTDEATILAKAIEAVGPSAEVTEESEAEQAIEQPEAELVAAGAEDGTERIDAAALAQLKADAAAGRQAREQQVEERRVALVTAAAEVDGKFTTDRIPHFVALHRADPEGTEALIASLAPGVAIPTGAPVGHSVTASAEPASHDGALNHLRKLRNRKEQ